MELRRAFDSGFFLVMKRLLMKELYTDTFRCVREDGHNADRFDIKLTFVKVALLTVTYCFHISIRSCSAQYIWDDIVLLAEMLKLLILLMILFNIIKLKPLLYVSPISASVLMSSLFGRFVFCSSRSTD